jgi:Flp pilus assembly protein TadB
MELIWAGLGRLSPAAWACAGLAALAVFGLMRPATGRLRPARDDRDAEPSGRPTRSPSWLTESTDGMALRRRLLLGAVAAAGACLSVSRLEPGPGSWAWLAWPLVAGLATVLLGLLEPRAVRLRRERLIADAPQALDLLAVCLAAGMPVRLAGRMVVEAFDGPVAEDLGRVLALADLGVAESEAWRTLVPHPQLGRAASDLSRCVDSGTLMVEALGRHAAAAREARRTALVVRARSVGVRSVLPLMTCFLPAFLLLGVVPTVVSALVAALG